MACRGFNRSVWHQEPLPAVHGTRLSSVCKQKKSQTFTMYHGTTVSAAERIIRRGFRQSADGMLGRGVYVSRDRYKAARYPLGENYEQVILKLRVRVGKVKRIDYKGHPLQKTWHKRGYNTAWVPPNCGMVKSGSEEDCVWDPKRIKVIGVVKAPPGSLQHLQQLLSRYRR